MTDALETPCLLCGTPTVMHFHGEASLDQKVLPGHPSRKPYSVPVCEQCFPELQKQGEAHPGHPKIVAEVVRQISGPAM